MSLWRIDCTARAAQQGRELAASSEVGLRAPAAVGVVLAAGFVAPGHGVHNI